jgi:hypothetical protein
VLVPDIVDSTLFCLLHAIDDGLLKLSFTASNGRTVDLSAEGLRTHLKNDFGSFFGDGLPNSRAWKSQTNNGPCSNR